ncbi:beta-defensin 106 [Rhinopithecus roxellana]|uniref:Beta-defensin n=2 Tax=Rhinopithecus TaxID=542827 RepID=A0A2K6MCX4_RHIBE|nr:beta-defensin 106 [Rhinopithecus roxellana]XP_017744258.1 PREDICTED: beta-defensin 106 [Rhinopithecus bieti]
MRTFLFLFAVLFFLTPAKNAFFDEKCDKLRGTCKKNCGKNEELTSLCQKSLKCCRIIQPCGNITD